MQRPWNQLEAYFRNLSQAIPDLAIATSGIADLCKNIAASHLARGLFAHSSMHDLWITQTETSNPPDDHVQFLILRPKFDGMVEYTLRRAGHPVRDETWRRLVPGRDVVKAFNKFLRQLSWNYHPIPE